MKQILWVDQFKRNIDDIYASYFDLSKVKIHSFDDYEHALRFISQNPTFIDLVISNYSVSGWCDIKRGQQRGFEMPPNCFDFYNKIIELIPLKKFIIYSSLGQNSFVLRNQLMSRNIKFISKQDLKAFDEIWNYLNPPLRLRLKRFFEGMGKCSRKCN